MAYGAQASLDHARPRLERALEEVMAQSEPEGTPTDLRMVVTNLIIAAGYLADALKYMKAGVP